MSEPPGDLRETYRRQMLDSIGGWTGTVITAIPTVVFIVVNAVSTLRWAVVAAVGSAVVLAGYRLARRQPVQQALTGLIGVVVAAIIAARTGQARGYFLLGIWSSFAYAAVFAGSLLVRRPIVGLAWEFLDPTPGGPDPAPVPDAPADGDGGDQLPAAGAATSSVSADRVSGDGAASDGTPPVGAQPWYRRRGLLGAYMLATLGATAVFLARGVVQLALFDKNATGWLAFARIAMGYPLYIAAVGFGFWVVRRARRRLAPTGAVELAPPDLAP